MLRKSVFTILLVCFTLIGGMVFGQEENGKTYTILDSKNVENIESYIDALNKANMKFYRLKNQRFSIVFDTGVVVELFSAIECENNGVSIDSMEYPIKFDSSKQLPTFSLGTNNYILIGHQFVNKKGRN
ncbi:MAG: hypothetical protein H6587_09225 [Flavobacteriales bacterium]|nr:hypothetical protein [Flavobacteriales bacterium]MCB9364737.1 hypothetical protein [Flavobacteriales bacterium]